MGGFTLLEPFPGPLLPHSLCEKEKEIRIRIKF